MIDPTESLNATSIFAGVMGLLFANWSTDIEKVLAQEMPSQYLDRKVFISKLAAALFYKAVPLCILTASFVYSQVGLFFTFLFESQLYVPFLDDVEQLSSSRSIFTLIFIALIYFLVSTILAVWRLVAALCKARKGRERNEPRVHILG